ncbi:cytochrome c biogenesis protein DipZ [Pseudomonas sp. CCI3.2]|uniref:cytochrome c biogenesis protein DipZ n=1 Tax=unclassified Pseudomonas TaxID=196821 RepID=UPI002AC9A6A7|nr:MULTISPECIES: cytochrome c biogenesis protein DipZ [unclassified Pseudomonas]MEB0076461.1 cytochrome c biogenesis protein DipZ [Pseudomonas sp. MH10out]MEB0091190.1 cytochrome c biogenesis protein DipZ [Pseudomonas sp. CCI4.2]MEB0100856.1 cytochrome c biogenesis protein DipZ [Pseudomonas sp. CCI3.2]MEB0128759.1 cytochrome c biogenesis protein DipZ [Pseudomonas sp. CCI2.4]MEB0157014.1 cytochrome c biogenesis protein DipZ [Pseudomonas sp. AH2 (2023)]
MLLIILSYLGGVLTILSPCILPVLPFVFARSGEPFRRSGLPLLCGMALTFALVATLAAVGGGWVVQANQYGRWLAIALMAFFGVTLLFPHLADRLTRPLVSMGDRLSNSARTEPGKSSVKSSFVLGVATGLLWAPCAGPILGLVLTGAALHGASVGTSFLLLAYAAGAATSLALALLIGGKLFTAMKRSLGAGEWLRRGLGVAMLCGVAAIALGLDTGLLTKVSTVATAGIEQKLLDTLSPSPVASSSPSPSPEAQGNGMLNVRLQNTATTPLSLPVEGMLPDLSGAVTWLNSAPLTAEQLKGKVVLIDFWTYSCINCLRSLPYVNAWAKKYHDQGLVVIGVHAPEFAFERDVNNVKKAVHDLGINYPVALDNDFAIWKGFNNQYWPAHYFVDAKGQIRYHHFGEGDYAQSEQVIQQLLNEAGQKNVSSDVVVADAQGVQKGADDAQMQSPETYLGYDRTENFASASEQVMNKAHTYAAPLQPRLNQWGLTGNWTAKPEQVVLEHAPGRIVYRFHARDLHLVLGPGADGKPVRFRVSVDGAAPGDNHGTDIAADGSGTVTAQRLYQLVRQNGPVTDHLFSIEFLDPGVQAYAFTFG